MEFDNLKLKIHTSNIIVYILRKHIINSLSVSVLHSTYQLYNLECRNLIIDSKRACVCPHKVSTVVTHYKYTKLS